MHSSIDHFTLPLYTIVCGSVLLAIAIVPWVAKLLSEELHEGGGVQGWLTGGVL